jgi:predicted NBD/HSP70 family sugar kinase
MPHVSLAIDVGGTTTRFAVAEDGLLACDVVSVPTPSPRVGATDTANRTFDLVALHAERLRDRRSDHRIDAIGVAFGAVMTNAGVIRNASILWLKPAIGLDVFNALQDRMPWAPVTAVNDIAAAAWHYRQLGRFAYVTVSTGIAIKIFDDSLSGARKLMLDPDWLGGESGHCIVNPAVFDAVPGGAATALRLGQAAAAGDRAARAELERLALPWCECGAVADLCAYASGPGTVRAAASRARRHPTEYAGSVLELTASDPNAIDEFALAKAAARNDVFTAGVLRNATRPLAARILQICADLGLSRTVIAGGFAHGIGTPWFDALRANLAEFMVDAGWFTSWTPRQRAELLVVPPDTDIAPLGGVAAMLFDTAVPSIQF